MTAEPLCNASCLLHLATSRGVTVPCHAGSLLESFGIFISVHGCGVVVGEVALHIFRLKCCILTASSMWGKCVPPPAQDVAFAGTEALLIIIIIAY